MAKREYTGGPIDMTQQHISERDLDEEAEDVEYATERDLAGQESVDFWPGTATPRESLNETQIAVIEAAANPTTEYDSAAELGRQVVPEMSNNYAHKTLWTHWPQCDMVTRSDGKERGDKGAKIAVKRPERVDEMRHRLVSGESTADIGEDFNITKDAVLHAVKEKYQGYVELDTETPPVEYTDKEWQFKDVEDEQVEKTEADQMVDEESEKNVNRFGQSVKKYEKASHPNPDHDAPVASGGDSSDDGSDCVAAAAAAIVVWELARRVVGRLR